MTHAMLPLEVLVCNKVYLVDARGYLTANILGPTEEHRRRRAACLALRINLHDDLVAALATLVACQEEPQRKVPESMRTKAIDAAIAVLAKAETER